MLINLKAMHIETMALKKIPFTPFLGLDAFAAVDKTKTVLGKST